MIFHEISRFFAVLGVQSGGKLTNSKTKWQIRVPSWKFWWSILVQSRKTAKIVVFEVLDFQSEIWPTSTPHPSPIFSFKLKKRFLAFKWGIFEKNWRMLIFRKICLKKSVKNFFIIIPRQARFLIIYNGYRQLYAWSELSSIVYLRASCMGSHLQFKFNFRPRFLHTEEIFC